MRILQLLKPPTSLPPRREHAQREAAELAAARSATLRAEEERTAAWTTVPQVGGSCEQVSHV